MHKMTPKGTPADLVGPAWKWANQYLAMPYGTSYLKEANGLHIYQLDDGQAAVFVHLGRFERNLSHGDYETYVVLQDQWDMYVPFNDNDLQNVLLGNLADYRHPNETVTDDVLYQAALDAEQGDKQAMLWLSLSVLNPDLRNDVFSN